MSRHGFLVLAFWLAAAFGDETAIPDRELLIGIVTGMEEVELGKAFQLTVVRVWSKELVPGDFNCLQLSPLKVRLKETTRREDDRHIEETRHYLCYAFSLEDITIPTPVFKAMPKDGGPERVVFCDPLTLRVKPALNPDTPGPAELPGALLPKRSTSPWLPWSVGGGSALAALALLLGYLRRRARRSFAKPAAPTIAPNVRALERLERLRERQPNSVEEIESYYVEAAALMREYIGERFAVRVRERTTEEFLDAPRTARVLQASHRGMLAIFLAHCDLVKFGRHMPTAPDREELLEAAARFLEDTRPGDTPEPSATVLSTGSGAA